MDESSQYRVVVNAEGQHSLLLVGAPIPTGWSDSGRAGTMDECLAYVREVWTDLRPLSLRQGAERRLPSLAKGTTTGLVVSIVTLSTL